MEKKEPSGGPPVLLRHDAPEVYASGLLRCDLEAGGIVKLTFGTLHSEADGSAMNQVVCLRLVMSWAAVENALQFTDDFMKKIQAANSPPPPDTTKH